MTSPQQKTYDFALYRTALDWYVTHGVDEALLDEAQDRFKPAPQNLQAAVNILQHTSAPSRDIAQNIRQATPQAANGMVALGKAEARAEAVKLAEQANTLEDLKAAILAFDGLAIKRTATNMVFADGMQNSPIMLIGDVPSADEDRQGRPFVGASGQLLDRILNSIGLDRNPETNDKTGAYLTNILNWRPPGNRTPTPAEIAVSLPFIEKHIILVQPKLLILCGNESASALLGQGGSISKLRNKWHDYKPRTQELNYQGPVIPAIATYHPTYLLSTPGQKRAAWQDMLNIQKKMSETQNF